MAGIFIPVVADATKLLAAFRKSAEAADALGRDLKQLGLTAEQTAQKQVEAATRRDARLRSEVAAYRQIAAAAQKGSREQIAAANLATQAEQRLSRSLAVTSREARMHAAAMTRADRELGRFGRGAIAGSGAARSLGRSLAFASGGFIAVASVTSLLRDTVDAGTEAAQTQRQLAAQFATAGKSLDAYRDQIERAALATSRLAGFDNDELLRSFTVAFRATQNVAQALRIMQASASAARGSHRDLAQVTLALTRAWGGAATSLRRLGILIPQTAKGMDAITFVQRRFAGQAAAGTTAQQRFAAALHNTQETAGLALYPTVTRLLNQGTDWLSQQKNQERIQRDVNQALLAAKGAIEGVKTVMTPLAEAFKLLGKAVGGTENAMKLLAGTFLLFELRTKAIKWGLIKGGIAGIGTSATTAAGEVTVLQKALLALGGASVLSALGAAAAAVGGVLGSSGAAPNVPRTQTNWRAVELLGLANTGKIPGRIAANAARAAGLDVNTPFGRLLQNPTAVAALWAWAVRQGLATNPPPSRTRGATGAAAMTGAAGWLVGGLRLPVILSPAQQRAAALAKDPNSRAALQAQATYDRNALAFLEQRRRQGKLTAKAFLGQYEALWGDLNDTQDKLRALDEEAARKAAEADRAAKARAAKAAREAKAAARARAKAVLQAQEAAGEQAVKPLQLAIAGGLALGVDTKAIEAQTNKTLQTLKKQASTLTQAIAKIKTAYVDAVKQARDEIGELFTGPVLNFSDAQRRAALGIPNAAANPQTLLADLQAQIRQARTFEANLARLGRRGAPSALIGELRGQGLAAAPEVAALAGANRGTLGRFITAFGTREKLAQTIAKAEMRAQLVTLRADKVELASIRRAENFIQHGAPTINVYIDGVEQRGAKVKVKTSAAQRRGPVPGQRALP